MMLGQFSFELKPLGIFPSVRRTLDVHTSFSPAEGFAMSVRARNVRSFEHGFNITQWSGFVNNYL